MEFAAAAERDDRWKEERSRTTREATLCRASEGEVEETDEGEDEPSTVVAVAAPDAFG